MKKRKGFTLVELLAVIVILAIIVLIATPIILKVIEQSKEGAAQRSVEGYLDTVEKTIIIQELKQDNNMKEGIYELPYLKNSVKGNTPKKGWFILDKGKIIAYSFIIDGYKISKAVPSGESETNVTVSKGTITNTIPNTYEVVKKCKLVEGTALEIGSKYSCDPGDGVDKNFYILFKEGHDVTLIMDRNIDDEIVMYNSNGSKNEMKEVKEKIDKTTSNWDNVEVSLPNYMQIYDANNKSSTLPSNSWLCSNLTIDENSTVYGYWTGTPFSGRWNEVWVVNCKNLKNELVGPKNLYGVRPTIKISRNSIQ